MLRPFIAACCSAYTTYLWEGLQTLGSSLAGGEGASATAAEHTVQKLAVHVFIMQKLAVHFFMMHKPQSSDGANRLLESCIDADT